MRTLAFDGRTGASGDMILAALLDAGADPDALSPVEEALPVRYEVGTATKNGIRATTVDVLLTDADAAGSGHDGDDGHEGGDDGHTHGHEHHHHDHEHGHGHSHEHGHDHEHHDHDGHHHDHDDHHHDHVHAEGHGAHRSYAEVVDVVEAMGLPEDVESDALATFRLLGEAESAVHGTDLDEVHFHEVGADDAVADVVGACLLLADLDVERVVTTPLAAGSGEKRMSHGVFPIPAPAVVEIAERADWSLRGGPVEAELLTPTGAAILGRLAEGVETLPTMRVRASGFGAGSLDFPEHPNVLRALVGDVEGGGLRRDEITVLETNLDDASPEVLGGLQETLKEAGARDVAVLPATMKKSRPGHVVKVVCKPADAERVAERLAVETGTLGVREHGAGHRWIADRRFVTATVDVGGESREVTVKVATTADGAVYDVSAEYDEAAAVAAEADVPVRDVMRRAEAAAERDAGRDDGGG